MFGNKHDAPSLAPAKVNASLIDAQMLDSMAADLIRRAATLDRLCAEIEFAAVCLDARARDLAQREDDVLKASLEMRERKGAFSVA